MEDCNSKDQLPAMPFYFGDWRKSPEIRALDLDVRMIWFEMLGLMWESTERGYLTLNGKAVITPVIAKMLGIDITTLEKALQQMEEFNVFSRRSDGAIFSRKMVRDEEKRKAKSRAGLQGMRRRYNKEEFEKNENNPVVITNDITHDITHDITKPEIENEYENIIKYNKKRGCGGKTNEESKSISSDKQKEVFDSFRKQYPGTKRGLDVEFANFVKKHRDWREVVELLEKRLNYQKEARQVRKENKLFVPEWKNLQTWINQRCWEDIINTEE
jgi:hypothetical protein